MKITKEQFSDFLSHIIYDTEKQMGRNIRHEDMRFIFDIEHYQRFNGLFGGRADQFPVLNFMGVPVIVRRWALKPILVVKRERTEITDGIEI